MKILITGITGFLGSHLAHKLLEQGHHIIALKRSYSNTHRIQSILPNIITYDIDKCNLTKPFIDCANIDAVIHTSTCYGRCDEISSEIFNTNLIFPMKLLEISIQFKVKIFFNTDTVSHKYLNNYSLSKQYFIDWAKYFSKDKSLFLINIRLEHIYGVGDDKSKFSTYIVENCLTNTTELKLTAGNQKRDFIYIDDVVCAYMLLLDKVVEVKKYFQEYDVGSGSIITIKEFVNTIHKITNSKTKFKFGKLPYRQYDTMHSKSNIIPLKLLGWVPKISLDKGIKLMIKESI